MKVGGSLGPSVGKAVKHYSSLFTLPTRRKIVVLLALICVCAGLLSTDSFFSLEWLITGSFLGFSFFFANLFLDYVLKFLVLKDDLIYDLRRTLALSLFCWVLWLFFLFVGVVFASLTNVMWWIKLCLLGFSAVIVLRLIVFSTTSCLEDSRIFIASVLQPFSCLAIFIAYLPEFNFTIKTFIVLALISMISYAASSLYVRVLKRTGKQTLGVSSLSLFKAFLLNWVADLYSPLENFFEKLGETKNLEAYLIRFASRKPKAVIVVPFIHPGPFKNVGSSLLPSLLKTTLEEKLGCIACIPHGLLGHEFDLASQRQNQKVIKRIVQFVDLNVDETKATPFIKLHNGLATVCCQIFGKFAFLSVSLAPNTTEDFPHALGQFVRKQAKKLGLNCCVIVNAHNSINGAVNMEKALAALKTAASSCLEQCLSLEQLPFEVGAATVFPSTFSQKDGMGPGGITVLVIKVNDQSTAYVVIDCNNMIAGVREKTLSTLASIGIDEGEVFTTDTHAVNAITLNKRGYHPLGEAINIEQLLAYVKEATIIALANVEPVKAGCCNIFIPNVKVIGKKLIETICLLVDNTLKFSKKVAVPIFGATFLFIMLILTFY